MHVILLTDSHYEEVPFQEIKPIDRIPNATATDRSNYLPWVRLHHIDAQELSPGKWVALVDGERFGGMSLIWKEDGEFVDSEEELSELRHGGHTIVIISVLFVVIVACYFFRRYRVDWFRRLSSPVAYLQKNFHHVAEFHDVSVRPTLLAIVHVHVIWGLAILISYIIFSNFSFFRSLATDSIIGAEYNLEPSNW